MNEVYRKELYKKALRKWGEDAQVFMAFEEFAELQETICHARRKNKIVFKCDLISELADVIIMLEQIKVIFDITEGEILVEKDKKLERLEEMITSKK